MLTSVVHACVQNAVMFLYLTPHVGFGPQTFGPKACMPIVFIMVSMYANSVHYGEHLYPL